MSIQVDEVMELDSITINFRGDIKTVDICHRKCLVDSGTSEVLSETKHRIAMHCSDSAALENALGTTVAAKVVELADLV